MWLNLLVFLVIINYSISAKILGVISTPSYSHQIAFRPVWTELALRGHQVTVFTTDPMNNRSITNLVEVDWSSAYEIYNARFFDILHELNFIKGFYMGANMVRDIVDDELRHPEVQKILNNATDSFDLVMIETHYPAMFAFSRRFNCSLIGLSSLDASVTAHEAIGNPVHPILYPDHLLPFLRPRNFYERMCSCAYFIIMKAYHYSVLNPIQDSVIRTHFGENFPSFTELYKNIAMLFINVNPIFHNIRPTMPNVIQFGGARRLQPVKELDKDLQEYLDTADEGFIYFNLGTNVKNNFMTNSTLKVMRNTFGNASYKVLWKYELDEMEEKPENVIIRKWFQQQDILRHRNIKVFITQGGIQSIEEAVFSRVPLIAIPFFGDQFANAQKIREMGYGICLNHKHMTEDSLRNAILDVINNPGYRIRVKEIAELVDDQPMPGLAKVIWWTEYVLRHKNIQHLKNPAPDLPSYQYYLLDVISFSIVVIFIFSYTTKKIVTCLIRKVQIYCKEKLS